MTALNISSWFRSKTMPRLLKFIKPQTGWIVVEVKFHVLQVWVFLFRIKTALLKANFLLFDRELMVLEISIDLPPHLLRLFLTIGIVHPICFSTPADKVHPPKALSNGVPVPPWRLTTSYWGPEPTDGLNLLLLVFALLLPFDDVVTGSGILQSFQHGHIFLINSLRFFT